MAQYVNRNDPRSKRTRKYLQQAFIELLAEKDFKMITINDITVRAGLNRATFYGHFQDKFELLDKTLGTLLEETIHKRVTQIQNEDEATLVRNLMLAICQWHTETSQRINRKLTLSASLEENAKKKLYSIIHSCLETERTQDKRKIEIKATLISWAIYGIVLQWNEQVNKESAELLVENALPFIMASVNV